MATTPIEIRAPTGLTLTADVFPANNDTAAQSGISLTEATNRKGVYDGNVTAAATGWHTVHVKSGGTVISIWDVLLTDDTTTYFCHDKPQEALHPTTQGQSLVDVTSGGAVGIDWGNVENPTTAVDLSATDIQLCDTVTTLTGHTAQTADHTANIAAILTDTGTTLDNHLTDIKGTGFIKDTHSLIDIETYVDLIDDGTSGLAKIATDVAAILVDTADMQPKLGTPAGTDMSADIAAVKAETALIVADTGTDGVVVATVSDGAIGAAAVADIFSTTTIAEAYAADGAAGTPAQILYLIQQAMTEFAITSTTKTIKKLDGTTTAATETLDDATSPTSITRAT